MDTGGTGSTSFFVCTGVAFFRVFFASVAIAPEAGTFTAAEAAGFIAGAGEETLAAVVLRARFGAGVAAGSTFGAFPIGFAAFFSFAGVAEEAAVSRAFLGARVVLPAVFVFARVRLAVGSEAVSGDRCCCSLSTEVIVSNFHT